MGLPIELRYGVGRQPVKAPSGKALYRCETCKDNFVEPDNRAFHEPVLCDSGHECVAIIEPVIKDQDEVYFDGKRVGYCKRARGAWVSLTEKVDDLIAKEIKALCEKTHGGTFKLQNGPYVPPELEDKYWKTAGVPEPPEPIEQEVDADDLVDEVSG